MASSRLRLLPCAEGKSVEAESVGPGTSALRFRETVGRLSVWWPTAVLGLSRIPPPGPIGVSVREISPVDSRKRRAHSKRRAKSCTVSNTLVYCCNFGFSWHFLCNSSGNFDSFREQGCHLVDRKKKHIIINMLLTLDKT